MDACSLELWMALMLKLLKKLAKKTCSSLVRMLQESIKFASRWKKVEEIMLVLVCKECLRQFMIVNSEIWPRFTNIYLDFKTAMINISFAPISLHIAKLRTKLINSIETTNSGLSKPLGVLQKVANSAVIEQLLNIVTTYGTWSLPQFLILQPHQLCASGVLQIYHRIRHPFS